MGGEQGGVKHGAAVALVGSAAARDRLLTPPLSSVEEEREARPLGSAGMGRAARGRKTEDRGLKTQDGGRHGAWSMEHVAAAVRRRKESSEHGAQASKLGAGSSGAAARSRRGKEAEKNVAAAVRRRKEGLGHGAGGMGHGPRVGSSKLGAGSLGAWECELGRRSPEVGSQRPEVRAQRVGVDGEWQKN
jgi:hypothetical protein